MEVSRLNRFATDSPLEERGFEPSVPPKGETIRPLRLSDRDNLIPTDARVYL